jgi:acyl-CoA synthetase (AMP-forming)/AMP-acid ligase II
MRVKEQAMQYFGPTLYEFYGSTELSVNTILRPEDVLRKPGSCGRAAPGIELAILDDAGAPVPVGEPGELYVRRYAGVFDGYYKNPGATRETQRGDWLSVGDVAYVDAEGFYYICDRKRDMIISGGVNIYPPRSRTRSIAIPTSRTWRCSACPTRNGASVYTPRYSPAPARGSPPSRSSASRGSTSPTTRRRARCPSTPSSRATPRAS